MYPRIGVKIKKAREEKYLSQAELGAKLGVTATAINYYEKGKRKISIDDLYRLASALEKPVDCFLPDEDEKKSIKEKGLPENSIHVFHHLTGIPVLGTIRAGEPLYAEQNTIGYLPFPQEIIGKETFALLVKGDSMMGVGICEGDLVLIRRQSYADFDGQIVCAMINGGETTIKIVFKEKDGRIRLQAANPVYPDIVLDSERNLTIQGIYAGVFKFPTKSNISTK